MLIYWTKRALSHLDSIYLFSKKNTKSERIASKLYNEILDEVEVVSTFPLAGKMEPLLEDMVVCYRSLVVKKHYKIVYFIDGDNIVYISAVWDCRMNPDFLKSAL